MQIELTVMTSDGQRREELTLRAAPGQRGRDLVAAVRGALRVPEGHEVWVADGPLPEDCLIGESPLLDGAELVLRTPPPGHPAVPERPPALALATISGPDGGRVLPLHPGRWTLGRSPACDLSLDDPGLSRVHLEVEVSSEGVAVTDLATTNGSVLDGEPLVPFVRASVRAGSVLEVGTHRLVLRPTTTRPATLAPRGDGTIAVSTTPAIRPDGEPATVSFPGEPAPPRRRRLPWPMLLVPLPLAAVMALVLGPRMLVLGLLSPVMILASHLSDRWGSRADARAEHAEWVRTCAALRERLHLVLEHERSLRHRLAPDPYEVLLAATAPSSRLWERRLERGDPFEVRVGVADLPAATQVIQGHGPAREHPPLGAVPAVLDLDESAVVGLAGPPAARSPLLRWLIGQVVTRYSPAEVSLVLLGDGWGEDGLRWTPHARTGPVATHIAALAVEVRRRTARPDGDTGHRVVVAVDDPTPWRASPDWRTILQDGHRCGVHVLIGAGATEDLPHECRAVIHCSSSGARLLTPQREIELVPDGVSPAWAHRVGRALAPLRDATPARAGRALPASVGLVDLVGSTDLSAEGLLRRWRERPTLEAPLGVAADGAVMVDLRRDGPHALVGGTTGSGKSELLQTWIAALALASGPDDLTFVLVDYKGGAAFAACADLPHTVGLLTDLDPASAGRALESLGAELRRRERLLAESGSADIDEHHASGHALPRLVIVVDEFRMLAEEQPSVLADLVRLAALGRSLGIHLVLATQRPGGIVSPEIRANVNLRISLRVRDRGDSEEVVGAPDAAALPEGIPGRAVMRTGDAAPTHFQTAYVGGRTDADDDLVLLDTDGRVRWRSLDRSDEPAGLATDLARAVTAARAAHALGGGADPHRPWLPPLPGRITADEVLRRGGPGEGAPAAIPWGLVDRPDRQAQETLGWSLADGHWAIIGAPGSGRTTAVLSLVSRAARDLDGHVVAHLVGPRTAQTDELQRSGHLGSLVDPSELPVLRRFVARLRRDVDSRREALRAAGHASYTQWWARWQAGEAGAPPPALLLSIDGWQLVSRPGTRGSLDLVEELESLVREGGALGLRAVVTGGRELLTCRLASSLSHRLVLRLADRADSAAAGVPRQLADAPLPPGRGVLVGEGALVQVALPSLPAGPVAPRSASTWRWSVHELPSTVDLAALELPGGGVVVLGDSGDPAAPMTTDLARASSFVVVGPPRSGRSTALRTMTRQLLDLGRPVVTVDDTGHELGDPRLLAALGPDDADRLVDLVREHDGLVVVADDLERLADRPVEAVLRQYADFCAAREGAVLTSASVTASIQVRGLVPYLCRTRHGLLLQPSGRADGDGLGVRVAPLPRIPGRGYLIESGQAHEVQVALCAAPVDHALASAG